jgi:hypothetical protein
VHPTAAIGEPEEGGETWGAIMVGVLQGPLFSECHFFPCIDNLGRTFARKGRDAQNVTVTIK